MFGAGSITSTLGLDVAPFTQGMLQANAIAGLFPPVVTNFLANPLLALVGIAGDAASAIKSAFLDVSAAADNAGESAQKLGVSTEFLTSYGAAAADAGSSAEGFADALKFVNNNAVSAAAGDKTASAAFAAIGVSATDAAGKIKPTEQLFKEIASGIATIDDPARRTAVAMDLMGRGGTDMLAAVAGGADGMKHLADVSDQLGATITTSMAASGDKVGTLGTEIGLLVTGAQNALATPIMDAFAGDFDTLEEKIVGLGKAAGPALATIGNVIGTIVVPAIEKLIDLATVAAQAVNAIAGVFGGGGSPVQAAGNALGNATGNAGTFNGSGSTPASSGTNVNIGAVNLSAVDVDDASTKIAGKVKDVVAPAVRKQRQDLDAIAGSARVKAGL